MITAQASCRAALGRAPAPPLLSARRQAANPASRPAFLRAPKLRGLGTPPRSLRGTAAAAAGPEQRGRRRLVAAAAAGGSPRPASGAAAAEFGQADGRRRGQVLGRVAGDLQAKLSGLFHPYSDPGANAKLLALCTAQMLGSVASLITETYLPVYLSDVLHMKHTQGAAQLLAKGSGAVSGTLADVLSPARMVLLGYAISALNKPMYAAIGVVAATAGATTAAYYVFFAKMFDRVAKGIREAPSKALLGELAAVGGDPPSAAFTLRQSLGTLGMMVGSLAAALAVHLSHGNYPLTFAMACVPASLALALLAGSFRAGGGLPGGRDSAAFQPQGTADTEDDSEGSPSPAAVSSALGPLGTARALLGALRPAYWQALAIVVLLYFARFDAAFATLRAKTVMPASALPLLIPCMLVPQVLLAPIMGQRAKTSAAARNRVLLEGMALMVAADACFAFLPSAQGVAAAAVLLGVHMAMTHGISLAMLASYIPSQPVPGLGRVAGTAWSITDLLLGVVLFASNRLAGRLSDATVARGLGGIGCFLGGGAATLLSMLALVLFSTFGELGRDDLLHPAAAAAKTGGGGQGTVPAEAAVAEGKGKEGEDGPAAVARAAGASAA